MTLTCSYPASVALALAAVIASASWLHFCTRLPAGRGRAAAALPTLLLNCGIPLLFGRATAPVSVAAAASVGTWLSSFKALAWASGRGPLAASPWLLPQFLVLYALPVVPCPTCASQHQARGAPTGSISCSSASACPGQLGRTVGNACLMAAAALGLHLGPPQFVAAALCAMWVIGAGGLSDGLAIFLAAKALDLHLCETWRAPWLSQSIAEFWRQRWNQAASYSLRTAIYEPIRDGAWVRKPAMKTETKRQPEEIQPEYQQQQQQQQVQAKGGRGRGRGRRGGSPIRAALGLCLACFMSGVVHEMVIAYTVGRTTGGAQLAFFSLQGPLVLLERWALSAAARAGVELPPAVRQAATVCLLSFMGYHLYFLPLERVGFISVLADSTERSARAMLGWSEK